LEVYWPTAARWRELLGWLEISTSNSTSSMSLPTLLSLDPSEKCCTPPLPPKRRQLCVALACVGYYLSRATVRTWLPE
jgi:hypothetical protein